MNNKKDLKLHLRKCLDRYNFEKSSDYLIKYCLINNPPKINPHGFILCFKQAAQSAQSGIDGWTGKKISQGLVKFLDSEVECSS